MRGREGGRKKRIEIRGGERKLLNIERRGNEGKNTNRNKVGKRFPIAREERGRENRERERKTLALPITTDLRRMNKYRTVRPVVCALSFPKRGRRSERKKQLERRRRQ